MGRKLTKEEQNLCRLITPEFRVSYPHVFKPNKVKEGDKPKYSITMLFPKDSDLMGQTVDGKPRSLKDVIKSAKVVEFGENPKKWPKALISPVTDGDDEKHAEKEGYVGHWVVKATTNEDQRPSVVDRDMTPLTEASDLYPGCYARAYIFARVYEYMGKQGVHFILDHVQKTRDGKSFGGKRSAENVFSPIDAGPSESSGFDDAGSADTSDDVDFK